MADPALPDPEGDYHEDLFDAPLETLPMPEASAAPGKPPPKKIWEVGGPSPNPAGRPPKTQVGMLTRIMQQQIEVKTPDGMALRSRRDLFSELIFQQAAKVGGGWPKLWAECQARDQRIRDAIEQDKAMSPTARGLIERERQDASLLRAIERVAPGLLDTLGKLQGKEIIYKGEDGRFRRAAWLDDVLGPLGIIPPTTPD